MGSRLATLEPEDCREVWKPGPPDAHKGSFGHLLIVSGSVGKTGAAVMAASAALRSGVGLVTVAAPRSALPMMAPALVESMWEPLEETPEGTIATGALPKVLGLLEGKTAAAIGPGLGQHPETVSFLKKLVQEVEIPTVLDADGINAFEDDPGAIPSGRKLALTPHPGEAARLLDRTAKDIQRNRLDAVRRLASELDACVALKGYRTLVGEPSGWVHINRTGNAGMASGGTGDVLTGIVGGFLARGLAVGDSLRLGVYLHGLSGDLAAEEKGQTSLTATDLIHELPKAIRQLDPC
jgi:NAD(P)H-hydrate epimerase